VDTHERSHVWKRHLIEFFAIGTAVTPLEPSRVSQVAADEHFGMEPHGQHSYATIRPFARSAAMDRLVSMAVFKRTVELGRFAATRHFGISPEMAGNHVRAGEALEPQHGAAA
jgi:hypothetical protein